MHTTALPTPLLVRPADAGYDRARRAWNLVADQRPAAVCVATSAEQVRAVVAYARDHGLRVAAQGTGHLAAALPSLEGTILLKTALHDGEVEVDVAARTARVKAGAVWEDVVVATAPHGLVPLHGSSPDVGVVGYLLAGGLSFYAREHGLAADHLVAIEVVTPDGELRRVVEGDDLFWALRGGGGGFGVVTAVELRLLPLAEVFAGALFWPAEDAAALLDAWRAWCADAPRSVTTTFRLLRLPPVDAVPPPLRGRPVVCVDGVALDDADGRALVDRLRAAAPPMLGAFGRMPAADVLRIHGDPEGPTPGIGDGVLLHELDDAAAAAFLLQCGAGADTPLLAAELAQLGGALSAPRPGGGARAHLEGAFLLFAVGAPMAPGDAHAIEEAVGRLLGALAPWATGTRLASFAERGGSLEGCVTPEALARLRAIRAAIDPDGRMVGAHAV